jgi:hypothetical protein
MAEGEEHRVFRVGGVSFLSILATDPPRWAAFSEAVFGWSIWPDPKEPAFEDGTGHVIGFVTDIAVAGEGGVRLHLCRERR